MRYIKIELPIAQMTFLHLSMELSARIPVQYECENYSMEATAGRSENGLGTHSIFLGQLCHNRDVN